MFTRQFDRRVYVLTGVATTSLLIGLAFGTYSLWPANVETGFQPEQPFEFSHTLHAGVRKIDCLYCHSRAEKGPFATVPPMSTCMKCHVEIQPKDKRGELKPAVKKMLEAWEKKEPVRWVKVHDLADFVYFDHSRHLASGATCADCHGAVEAMDRVRRVYSLKMGWCLECHRQPPTELTPEGQETRAPVTCSTCHR